MKSIHKKIISIGLLSTFFELALIQYAHAGILGDVIGGMSSWVVMKIALIIGGILSWVAQMIFMVGGMLIELGLRLNNNILDPNANIFLFKGWTILVNIADLALVIALIVIAFATMLDSQTYGMKKALPRLIIVALLVNFSLVIPGVFVDIAGMTTEFFLEQSGLVGANSSAALASALNISGFLDTNNTGMSFENMSSNLSAALAAVGSSIFATVFTLVGAMVLLTIAAMILIRFFMLSFMLALTPVIFVAWIFPGTREHWDKWWNDFIRWTMFPPVMVFFIWLSLTSLKAFRPMTTVGQEAGTAGYAFGQGVAFGTGAVVQMVMAVAFLVMSLIAANSISITGAKGGKNLIGSMTGWTRGKLEGWGKGTQAYARREAERQGRRAGAPVVAAISRKATAMRKYEGEKGGIRGRVAGVAGRALGGVTATQQAALKKTYEDKFKGMSDDDLAMRYSTMAADEKVFAAQQLASKGNLNKINEKILERDIADASTEAVFAKYGGEKAHANFVKAAGRNKDMIDAKKDIDAAGTDVAKKATAEKKYKDVANNFYAKNFKQEDYKKLGDKFFTEGKYGDAAMAALLLNEPGALGKVLSSIGKTADAKKYVNERLPKIKQQVHDDLMKNIEDALRIKGMDTIAEEVNKELIEVMKGLKATDEDIKKVKGVAKMFEWIKERDEKTAKKLGGNSELVELEDKLQLLQMRHNEVFMQMDQAEDYRHSIRIQDSMKKSVAKRLYIGSEEKKEEKKEDKKA